MTAYSTIVATHVCDTGELDKIDLAFSRLGGFLDRESDSIETLGSELGLPSVGRLVRALHALDRDAGLPDAAVLRSARDLLFHLRMCLVTLPTVAPGSGRPDLDAALRYLGARVEDQVIALDHLL